MTPSPWWNAKEAAEYIFGKSIKSYSYKAVLRWMKCKKLKSGKRGKERVTKQEWCDSFILSLQ